MTFKQKAQMHKWILFQWFLSKVEKHLKINMQKITLHVSTSSEDRSRFGTSRKLPGNHHEKYHEISQNHEISQKYLQGR